MARMREADEEKDDELQGFVDRIAALFSENNLSSAELVLSENDEKYDCHLSGYRLHEAPLEGLSKKTKAFEKEREYVHVMLDDEATDAVKKSHLMSAAIGVHRFSLQQDLHFDAFRKLLYEKGLMVREVVDWKIERSKSGEAKIKEVGESFSAVEHSPNTFSTLHIITKKTSSKPQ